MPKLEPYSRKLSYSYALGIFPCMNLLEARPQAAQRLLVDPAGEGSEGVRKLIEKCDSLGVRVESAERVLRRESKKDNCMAGIVFEKYSDPLDPSANHIVLAQISDGGNLGSIVRSALGFGYKDVAVIRPCVDVFDPHVVRASMGAFFRLRLSVFDSFDEYRAAYPGRMIYPFMLDGAIELDRAVAEKKEPFTLVFGNEGAGLPSEYQTYGQSVLIPQSDEIDSLNLSNAVSIAAYTFRKK